MGPAGSRIDEDEDDDEGEEESSRARSSSARWPANEEAERASTGVGSSEKVEKAVMKPVGLKGSSSDSSRLL